MSYISRLGSAFSKSSMFASEFFLDLYMYAHYCGISPFQDRRNKTYYKLIIETHAIEKGLSLANPRMLFGRKKITEIMKAARRYGIGSNDLPILMATGALQDYLALHRNAGLSDPLLDSIDAFLTDRATASAVLGSGGLRHYPDGMPSPSPEKAALLTSRFSCRMFSPEPLDADTVKEIVRIAQTAPSQCNRQATKIHFYSNRERIGQLLALQAGSAGFAETVTGLVVVAFDLAAWGGAQQRNQGYVDASLFAMNLMLAAHAMGAASCPLNLAVPHSTERQIKIVGEIPKDQRLVMMIALGRPADGPLKSAASPRRTIDEVLTIRDQAVAAA